MPLATQIQQSTTYLCHNWKSLENVLRELLTIWLNLGCTTITEHPLCQILGCRDTAVRLNVGTCMVMPQTRTQLGRRSFHVAAPVAWNALPVYLRSTSISRGQFRAGLNQAYKILWEHFVLRVYCTYLLTLVLIMLTKTPRIAGCAVERFFWYPYKGVRALPHNDW